MDKLRVLDLFSGIGGFSLGLERTGGFETVAFCEIEPFPRKVLAKHWPGVPCYDDVRTLTAERLAADGIAVDVICGGFPCQDLSIAQGSSRAGLDGARSGLWSEYARLIGELRPQFVFVENVTGLLSLGLGRVLGELAELGYDAEWECIPAGAVGAPHIRNRLWLVGYPNNQGEPAFPVYDEAPGLPRLAADATRLGNGLSALKVSAGRHLALDGDWWNAEPALCRVADGVPDRAHRLKALGNAVVPQIPELIGRAILASLQHEALAA